MPKKKRKQKQKKNMIKKKKKKIKKKIKLFKFSQNILKKLIPKQKRVYQHLSILIFDGYVQILKVFLY